ncbi:MAG: glycosyltransferase family 4 protein [Rhizobiaceae bacterium]|nr:glycosyltransferase family 4 protein [Rhizobiaceae bacterium]
MNTGNKIGIVLKGYPRLSETFISQEILALEKLGFNLQIISLRHPTDKAVHPINREISAQVSYLPEYIHNEPLRVFKAWRIARKFDGYSSAWRAFRKDLVRDFTRNRFRRFAQGLVIAAEYSREISCLYAHFLHTPTSATRYAALMAAKPFAISAHAKDIWTSPDWEITEKLDDCQWLATCTAGARDHLQTLSHDPKKVHLVYHGLDLKRFPSPKNQPSNRNGSDENNPLRIITVGRAVAKKGLDNLLNALSNLPASLHWQWTHIGGGPLRDQLKAQADSLGISHKCTFRGALDQRDVITAYNNSDLFVLPCRIDKDGDRDGLPNVIVEAQSQGLAVISSPISGIPELIENEKNGLLVEPDKPDKLAAAIIRLADDTNLRNSMGSAGEAKVRAQFNHHSTIGDLADLLRELVSNSQTKKQVR